MSVVVTRGNGRNIYIYNMVPPRRQEEMIGPPPGERESSTGGQSWRTSNTCVP